MIVDDRLDTVLRTSVAGKTAARTQLRQLVDLLGAVPLSAWNRQHAAALQRVDSLAAMLSDEECAAVLRAVPHRSAVLVYHFAQGAPRTAAAAVAAACLPDEDWLALIPRLPTAARGFVRHRGDLGQPVRDLLSRLGVNDFLLPEPAKAAQPALSQPAAGMGTAVPDEAAPPLAASAPAIAEPAPAPIDATSLPAAPSAASTEGIGAIVKRIEAFRRRREDRDNASRASAADGRGPAQGLAGSARSGRDGLAPRLPFADDPAPERPAPDTIDLRTDADGIVTSAAIDPPGMLIGSRPFTADQAAPVHCNAAMARAFRQRQPVCAGMLEIEGAAPVSGRWQADGTPLFAPDGGRFAGYVLRLRRQLAATGHSSAPADAGNTRAAAEADRLRQLLHELRTPINAIQGFAEMIQSQALGTTPHQYRAMAASIAADAAQILAGFEEVERLVKLESRAIGFDPGEADIAAITARLIGQVMPVLAARNVRLSVELMQQPQETAAAPASPPFPSPAPLMVQMASEELERSIWRVLAVIAASVAPGERLALSLQQSAAPYPAAVLVLPLPASLAMLDDEALFAPDANAPAASLVAPAMLGNGFALRLARAEITAGGGTLRRDGNRLLLTLPLASSDGQSPAAAPQSEAAGG
ncbi:MAG: histidine kinase dimerization/phospho-acceptor domain-containing protein [Novosphingobium sp.]